MDYKEALEWLKGNRSTVNSMSSIDLNLWELHTAQADAARTQQAYYIVKAHHEGLLNAN